MIICGQDLLDLVYARVIENVTDDLINAGSIDITCGENYIIEPRQKYKLFELTSMPVIDLLEKSAANVLKLPDEGYCLLPGQCILLESEQVFNLPDGNNAHEYSPLLSRKCAIFAEYKLKSTMARNFVDAFNAGWCDAGWHGARLTIELRNCNDDRMVRIRKGDRIGQMIFYQGSTFVPENYSYKQKGRYNNTGVVTGSR